MTFNASGGWGYGGIGTDSRTPFFLAEYNPNDCRARFNFKWKSDVENVQRVVMKRVVRIVILHSRQASLFCGYEFLDYLKFDRTKIDAVRADIERLLSEFPEILGGVDISLSE